MSLFDQTLQTGLFHFEIFENKFFYLDEKTRCDKVKQDMFRKMLVWNLKKNGIWDFVTEFEYFYGWVSCSFIVKMFDPRECSWEKKESVTFANFNNLFPVVQIHPPFLVKDFDYNWNIHNPEYLLTI